MLMLTTIEPYWRRASTNLAAGAMRLLLVGRVAGKPELNGGCRESLVA